MVAYTLLKLISLSLLRLRWHRRYRISNHHQRSPELIEACEDFRANCRLLFPKGMSSVDCNYFSALIRS